MRVVPTSGLFSRGDLRPGSGGLEQRLAALHYWVGVVDDVYDADTAHAVTAFQKVMGLNVTVSRARKSSPRWQLHHRPRAAVPRAT